MMRKIALTLIIIACLADILMTFILPLFYPGYNQIRTPVSMLGSSASPVAGIASAWWIMLGVLFMISGTMLIPVFSSSGRMRFFEILPAFLLIIYGFGEGVASGIFVSEHAGDYSTLEGTLHNLISGAGLLASVLTPLSMMKVVKTRRYRIFSAVIFITGIILLILFQLRYIIPGNGLSLNYLGMWQRLLMLNFYTFLIIISFSFSDKKS